MTTSSIHASTRSCSRPTLTAMLVAALAAFAVMGALLPAATLAAPTDTRTSGTPGVDVLGTDTLGLWDPSASIAPAPETADPTSTIVGLALDRAAFSPNADGVADSIRIDLGSTVAQHVRIAVVDATGSLVRVIADANLVQGPAAYEWDGMSDAGPPAPDGSYAIVVDAGAAAASEHVSQRVVLDRVAPTITRLTSRVVLPSQFARSFQLPVTLSEPAVVDVAASGRAGGIHATSVEAEGRIKLVVPVLNRAPLRRILAKRRVPVAASVVATDPAGNRTVRRIAVALGYGAGGVGAATAGDTAHLSFPVSAPITSRFGMRWGRLHAGVDFGAHIGQPIGAAAAGTVTQAGWMSGYGNAVLVDHGGGLATLYAHQSQIVAHVGATVQRGELIGYTGNTGNSTGPHLHFEVHVNGVPKDPMGFLP